VTPPPARERNRQGIRFFSADRRPEPREALFDKIVVRVRGSVRARNHEAIRNFAANVSSSPTAYSDEAPRLFGVGSWKSRRWSAPVVSGSTISDGELQLHLHRDRQPPEAGLNLELWLNPIRTLEHLLARHDQADFASLSPAEFFRRDPEPTARNRTLDGRDNMISDFLSFGGSAQLTLERRIETYLETFERALKGRLLQELCPVEQGYDWRDDCGDLVADNDEVTVRLDWSGLNVSQCEVCWERVKPDALEAVHQLGEGILRSARTGEVQLHPELEGAAVARELGAATVKLPLVPKGNVLLVLYAKARDRLRLEVRYLPELTQDVRDRLPPGPRSLVRWLNAFSEDAARRLRWDALTRMLTFPQPSDREALLDLVEAVQHATQRIQGKRRRLLSDLLTFGAVTATGAEGHAPIRVLDRLASMGVVEHVRLVARDAEMGRRFALAPRFRSLVELFAPESQEDGEDLPSQ
jgi:hypothetical protein